MNRAPKIVLLRINLGTPSRSAVPDARRYLRQLLMDERAKAPIEIAGERLRGAGMAP